MSRGLDNVYAGVELGESAGETKADDGEQAGYIRIIDKTVNQVDTVNDQ